MEAVIRIRASRGLRMNAFHGNFFIRSTDLLALPNVPRDQNYCVEVILEDDLKTPTVCFQTALLHTSCTGERRIRVVTLCLPVTNSMSELYASVNQKAVAAYLGTKGSDFYFLFLKWKENKKRKCKSINLYFYFFSLITIITNSC